MSEAPAETPRDSSRWLPAIILGAWALAAIGFLIAAWARIGALEMPDPDDSMRLLEVRDWIAGQGWFDVSQYRLNPPEGYRMHWSRIVDLPIAALILILRPLVGAEIAEMAAAAAVPLLILGGIATFITLAANRIGGFAIARFVPLFVVTTPLILFQSMPLRIDHHGWQLLCGATAFWALLDRDAPKSGMIGGFACALWLHISLESLPMVAAMAGLLGLRWVIAAEHGVRLRAFMTALAGGSAALFIATRDPALWRAIVCDQIAVVHLAIFLFGAIGAIVAGLLTDKHGPIARLIAGGVLAGGAGAIYLLGAPVCAAGPFASLDPLVRQYWYYNVLEGQPIWRQKPGIQLLLLYPIVGLAGLALGWRAAISKDERRDWASGLLLLAAAIAVSLMVQRAGAYAALIALPGCAALADRLLARSRRIERPVARVLASVGGILLTSPLLFAWGSGMLMKGDPQRRVVDRPVISADCDKKCADYGALNRMEPSYILAPMDLGPALALHTPHRMFAAGYHRNSGPMRDTIRIFTGSPEIAHRIMREKGMQYLLISPRVSEALLYSQRAPDGLMARLRRGQVPQWLEPIPLGPSRFRLWRLREATETKHAN